jgi:GT2 family glycosyltransferase
MIDKAVVAICTRNRPKDLERCLRSVREAGSHNRKIYVVDSSEGSDSEAVCKMLGDFEFVITYLRCTPGLTIQRNHLVSSLPSDTSVVHFIDDDSVPNPGYFQSIEEAFQSNPEAIGVGGAILNLPVQKWRILDRIFGVSSKRQGVVLRSGVNILNFTGFQREVDWLSGCSMSFLYDVLKICKFDEMRAGNGIGEDVDFCLRAKEHGKLIWTPSATQLHLQSPINRLGYKENRQRVLAHRLKLASDKLGRVNKALVRVSFLYEDINTSIKPFIKRILKISE